MIKICTERLVLIPLKMDELEELVKDYKDVVPELSQAYNEMLESCRQHPEQLLWYTSWKICKADDLSVVGFAGFKGVHQEASEIGYGIEEEYQGNGYATEAVQGLCNWAFSTELVHTIVAEAEAHNQASLKVLQKNGFLPTGEMGEEGPRFLKQLVWGMDKNEKENL